MAVFIFFSKEEKDLQNDFVNINKNKAVEGEAVEAMSLEISKKIKVFEEKKKEFEDQVKKASKTSEHILKWKGEASSDSLRFVIELLEEQLENINNNKLNESYKTDKTDNIDTNLIFNNQKDVLLKRLTEFLKTRYKIHKKELQKRKNRQAEAAREILELVKELLNGGNQ